LPASIDPSAFARADHRVQLVDEQNDLPIAAGDFLDDRFEPILKFAAIFRPGDQRAHVQRDDPLVLQHAGTSPLSMRMARPSTMAVLPTPGSPMSTGLFFVRRPAPASSGGFPHRGR
jgi:hypothetical protein